VVSPELVSPELVAGAYAGRSGQLANGRLGGVEKPQGGAGDGNRDAETETGTRLVLTAIGCLGSWAN